MDEAQDTAEDQWQCIRLLSTGTQMMCLADLDQQIYDFRPSVSSDRVTHIMAALRPLRADLAGKNYRSPDSEIVTFANDVLLNRPRGAAYCGVSRLNYPPKREERDKKIRQAIGIVKQRVKDASQSDISIAVLATWGRGINVISRALTGDGTNMIPHRVIIDEASVLLSSRMVAFLLEPRRSEAEELLDLADGLELAAAVFRAHGGNTNLVKAQRLATSMEQSRAGILPRSNGVASKLLCVLRMLRTYKFSGNPKRDWLYARDILHNAGTMLFQNIAKDAEQLVVFQRGRRISAELTEMWQTHGTYQNARNALDAAIAKDQLLSGGNDLHGIHVMTIHKSKGKEFDAVIIFDDPNNSPLLYPKEAPNYPFCRKLIRVGITRARYHVLMLCNLYEPTDLLLGHRL
jgi:DNA helicase-2/ATP-dependent DNA helicase PcrA